MDNELDTSGAPGGLNALRAIAMGANPMAGLDALTQNPTDPSTRGLAFQAGILAPTKSGHFSEALSNAYGAQAEAQTKEAELKAKYAPIIAQALLSRQMATFNMMAQQYKLTQEWDGALTSATTGLLRNPEVTPQDVVGAVGAAVRNGTVPGDFANEWIRSLPMNNPAKLKEHLMSKAIGLQNPAERVGSVIPKVTPTDTGAGVEFPNTNPLAGPVGQAGPYALPKALTPAERLPNLEPTPMGPRLTSRVTGNSGIAGTPAGRDVAAQAQGLSGAQPAPRPDYALVPPVRGDATPPAQVPPVAPAPAPAVGTSAAIDPAQMKVRETDAADLTTYGTKLADKLNSMRDLQMRINFMRDQAQSFQPGATAALRQKLGGALKDLGLWAGLGPDKAAALGDKFAGGDISSAQAFEKVAVQGAMEALRAAVETGRITQAEFAVFKENNPSIKTDPKALEKINNFATEQYQKTGAEHDYLSQYVKGGGASRIEFTNNWDKRSRDLGYTKPALKTGITSGSTAAPTSERISTSKSGRRVKEVPDPANPGGHMWVYMDEGK